MHLDASYPDDEQVRYGGLLFADSVEEYYGWEAKTKGGTGDRVKGILSK